MCPVPLHMKFDCPLPELNCHISVTAGGDHGGGGRWRPDPPFFVSSTLMHYLKYDI